MASKLDKSSSKKIRNIILLIVLAFLITGGLLYYFNYRINQVRSDFQSILLDLTQQMKLRLNSIESNLDAIADNLSLQIHSVDTSLQNFKKQNQLEINTLSQLIDEIERQSNIKLNELKIELSNIKVKSADFSGIVDEVLQSVASVKTNLGQGSGVIIDTKGYVVTNVHVISGASTLKVTTYSGETFKVNQLVGYDEAADIAVLKIEASGLKALDFGDSDELKVGQKVIAAGNPAGLSFTVTEGIVSAFRTGPNNIRYIQTDVPINPGSSGGPLINAKGEIIGINNFKIGGFEGLGFAISSNNVKKSVNKIISDYEAKQNQ